MKMPFRTKLIGALFIIILTVFTGMGIYMTLYRIKEVRSEIVGNARMFVTLTSDKIGDAFLRYFKTAFFKFRAIILEQRGLNTDLENIQIIDLTGRIQYDMAQYEKGIFFAENPYSTDPFVLQNIKKMEMNINADDHLCIIVPYVDEYGVHNYSIVYHFSLKRISKEVSNVVKGSIAMGLSMLLLSVVLAVIASNRITGHLAVVSKAAKEIAEGDFNKVITIKTGDEFEDLANAFNYMTEKIREDIRELNNLIKELERRDTQKTQFLANISHELRTPLTVSIGYVDYLKKEKMGPLNEDQKHSLEIISRNLERLNKEIHSLLLVSRFTLEGVKLSYEIFDISDAIENILNNFVPEMKLKRLVVKKDIRVRLVYADKEGINTVLENLISNGIKFSEPDTNLEIKTCIINENNQEYFQFKISNHGIGIPEDQLEKIFEPFYQVDATTSRRYGGIGLGLSIARNIIEAHQGKIWAESRGGVTCFYFKIPNRRV